MNPSAQKKTLGRPEGMESLAMRRLLNAVIWVVLTGAVAGTFYLFAETADPVRGEHSHLSPAHRAQCRACQGSRAVSAFVDPAVGPAN